MHDIKIMPEKITLLIRQLQKNVVFCPIMSNTFVQLWVTPYPENLEDKISVTFVKF